MEKIPYPSSYFDPYRNEPTHSRCDGCQEWFDNGDLEQVADSEKYFCRDCMKDQTWPCNWCDELYSFEDLTTVNSKYHQRLCLCPNCLEEFKERDIKANQSLS